MNGSLQERRILEKAGVGLEEGRCMLAGGEAAKIGQPSNSHWWGKCPYPTPNINNIKSNLGEDEARGLSSGEEFE